MSNQASFASVAYNGSGRSSLQTIFASYTTEQLNAQILDASNNMSNASDSTAGGLLTFTPQFTGDISAFEVGDHIQIEQDNGGFGAVLEVDSKDTNANTLSFSTVFDGQNYEVDINKTITLYTDGDGDINNVVIEITGVSSDNHSIAVIDAAAQSLSKEAKKNIRNLAAETTASEYETHFADGGAVANAIENSRKAFQNLINSVMASVGGSQLSYFDSSGNPVTPSYPLSTVSRGKTMLPALDDDSRAAWISKVGAVRRHSDNLGTIANNYFQEISKAANTPLTPLLDTEVQEVIDQMITSSSSTSMLTSWLVKVNGDLSDGNYPTEAVAAAVQVQYNQAVQDNSDLAVKLEALRLKMKP